MSGQDSKDKNYLPARVYLTREAKLVCRGGSVVGFITFNSQASSHLRADHPQRDGRSSRSMKLQSMTQTIRCRIFPAGGDNSQDHT